ncbi:MAG: AraC family transcriptional regulator [Clostridiales bacterium]|nr:AraC family transcriptional regulator [Clostridiales bacterium]
MQTKYTNLDIHFSLEHMSFTVLNLVYERFLRSIPKHSHSRHSYEIHYVSEGYGTAVIEGISYSIVPNTLYVTGPGVEHEQFPTLSNPMVEYCINLKIAPNHQYNRVSQIVTLFENTVFWFGQDTEQIGPLMEQLFSEMQLQALGYKLQVESLLSQCIVKMVRNYQTAAPTPFRRKDTPFGPSNLFEQKYIIIEECFLYDYRDITLTKLSALLGLSTRQTERLLKQHYGKTFLQKRNDARMAAAVVLLVSTNESVNNISESLGYSTVEHFSNAFRRHYNVSPTNYRKNIANFPST